jgi:predicted nucleotidyltransferase
VLCGVLQAIIERNGGVLMLDKATVREIAAKYADEVCKVLNPDSVILFGSYVNGNPNEWSDIDIAVIVNGFSGDWLKVASTLCALTRRVSNENFHIPRKRIYVGV